MLHPNIFIKTTRQFSLGIVEYQMPDADKKEYQEHHRAGNPYEQIGKDVMDRDDEQPERCQYGHNVPDVVVSKHPAESRQEC